MDRLRTAILGCTGLVGQQFARLLSGHPVFEAVVLTSSSRSAGHTYGDTLDAAEWEEEAGEVLHQRVVETSVPTLLARGVQVAFSGLPTVVAGSLEHDLRARGVCVFSNASAHRMDPDVPIVIPEVNPDHLSLARPQRTRYGGFIVTNSNCVVAGLALALAPLVRFGLRSVVVTTLQSASGAGRHGLSAWDVLDNVVPFIRDEEAKIERETRKILGWAGEEGVRDLDVSVIANATRVPVRQGHLGCVVATLDRPADEQTLTRRWADFEGAPQRRRLPTAPERPMLVQPGETRPQPRLDREAGRPGRARGMSVTIGRVQARGHHVRFVFVVNNTVRGAAGGAVLNAELAHDMGMLAE